MNAIKPASPPPRAGSPEAFGEILRVHQGRVRAYLRRYVADADVADDLAQETFLAAYRSLPARNPAAPLDLWLLSIARHRALRHLRDEAGRRVRGLGPAFAAWTAARVEADAPRLEERDRELAALRDCLRSLPKHGADLIAAHYERRLPSAEIARRAGRTESAVRMTLLRLRDLLKQCVRDRLAGAETGS
jgi:RNA polymerase sigma-70 factor, ECF subfamily